MTNRTHGLYGHPLYYVWREMCRRCADPKNKDYKNYGARGIQVCERWRHIANFVADMGPSYRPGLTLERLDVNEPYECLNCTWIPRGDQRNNCRNTAYVDTPSGRMTMRDAARSYGINRFVLRMRIERGWDVERALTTPIMSGDQRRRL